MNHCTKKMLLVWALAGVSPLCAQDVQRTVSAIQQAQIQNLSQSVKMNLNTQAVNIAQKWRLSDTYQDEWLRLYNVQSSDYYGGLATDKMWTRKLYINGQWLLSDTHGDDWLRLYNSSGTDYYGGLATSKLWSKQLDLNGVKLVGSNSLLSVVNSSDGGTATMWVDTLVANKLYGETLGKFKIFSDARLKHDIQPMDSSLQRLLEVKPVSFHYNDSPQGPLELGFIAQDLAHQFPELISEDNRSGYLSVSITGLLAPMIKGMQEQQAMIDEQKNRLRIQELELKSQALNMQVLQKSINELLLRDEARQLQLKLLSEQLSQ